MPDKYSKANSLATLPVLINDYMVMNHMACSRQRLDESLDAAFDEKRYNPIEEMLASSTWDGKDRVTELTNEIMGLEDEEVVFPPSGFTNV